jgi:hypothetical protein
MASTINAGIAVSVAILWVAVPPCALATTLAPAGQRAKLEYTIEVEGKASASNAGGEYQRWSTRRLLTIEATLVAQKPSVVDPGEPGGLHRAPKPPEKPAFRPSESSKALFEEMGRCGDDLACRMAVSQKMRQSPQVQSDMSKAKQGAESIRNSPPRYQIWYTDPTVPVTGVAKMGVQREDFFRTAVDERRKCTESAEMPAAKAVGPAQWPTTIRIDAKDGTFVANVGGPAVIFLAKIDCVSSEGKRRYEEHSQTGIHLLPEKYRDGPAEFEHFRGGADAATGGRRLAHGSRELRGLYGTLIGDVPMAAKVVVRWTVTLKD